jgi:hypothetical protein
MARTKPKAEVATQTPSKGQSVKNVDGVVVIGPQKGRWRIGRHFGPGETYIAASELNETQIAALQADAELVVIVGHLVEQVAVEPEPQPVPEPQPAPEPVADPAPPNA